MKTYQFLAEYADRRTKEYKALDKMLDNLVDKYGKESKEVNDFFETDYKQHLTTKDIEVLNLLIN